MGIKANQIGKRFQNSIIWKGLDVDVSPSNPLIILGSNGSGKSTLLKSLLYFDSIQAGNIEITSSNGSILNPAQVRRESILVGPMVELSEFFTVKESLEFITQFKECTSNSISDILFSIQLEHHQNKLVSELSSGMRQRLLLSTAFYFKAQFYGFDEPFMNLDQYFKDWAKEQMLCIASSNSSCLLLASNEVEEYSSIGENKIYL